MKKIVVIDGQGGKMGALLVGRLKIKAPSCAVYAVGTNSIATAAMMKAGADFGATGENPVVVNCRDADLIVGPVGIVMVDALVGEITSAMAAAVGQSDAQKVLLPINRCNTYIVGVGELSMTELVESALTYILSVI